MRDKIVKPSGKTTGGPFIRLSSPANVLGQASWLEGKTAEQQDKIMGAIRLLFIWLSGAVLVLIAVMSSDVDG